MTSLDELKAAAVCLLHWPLVNTDFWVLEYSTGRIRPGENVISDETLGTKFYLMLDLGIKTAISTV